MDYEPTTIAQGGVVRDTTGSLFISSPQAVIHAVRSGGLQYMGDNAQTVGIGGRIPPFHNDDLHSVLGHRPSYCGDINARHEWDRPDFTIGRKPIVMPGKYDGSSPLWEYLDHFKLVAQVNCWSSNESALYLGVSLEGPARRLLHGIDLAARDGYARLVSALERRFQPRDQQVIYRARLKSRRQQKGESVSQLGDAIEQLVRQAYPSADSYTLGELCKDYFTAALSTSQHRQWVHQSRPTTFTATVAAALHAEAYFTAEEEYALRSIRVATESTECPGVYGDRASVEANSRFLRDMARMLSVLQGQLADNSASQYRDDYQDGSTRPSYRCRDIRPMSSGIVIEGTKDRGIRFQVITIQRGHRQRETTADLLVRSGVSRKSGKRPICL